MGEYDEVFVPRSADDTEGAWRTFEEFNTNYSRLLEQVGHYLDQTLNDLAPPIAQAYQPWQKALQDLYKGAYLMAKKIKLPNPEAFFEALQIFSLDSAVQFLRDLCISCKIKLEQEWEKQFQKHVNTLLFAYSIIMRRQQEESLAR